MTTGLMLTRTTYILSAGVKKQAIPWRPPSVSSFDCNYSKASETRARENRLPRGHGDARGVSSLEAFCARWHVSFALLIPKQNKGLLFSCYSLSRFLILFITLQTYDITFSCVLFP